MKEYRTEVYNCLTAELLGVEYNGNTLSDEERLVIFSMLNFVIVTLAIKDGVIKNLGALDAINNKDYDLIEALLKSTFSELKNNIEFANKHKININLTPEIFTEIAAAIVFALADNAKKEFKNGPFKNIFFNYLQAQD